MSDMQLDPIIVGKVIARFRLNAKALNYVVDCQIVNRVRDWIIDE